MQDGSDAVSDWPLLNALLNTASGATWVSLHHGGGVGMGFSQHAGMVIVADGTEAAANASSERLWNDPATGVMRHADAGYDEAIACAREMGLKLPSLPDRQREAVMLVDGAHCTPDELAELLDCSPDEAGRLVTHARAALLARLRATQRLPFPPERATSARRPGTRAGHRRPRSGHTDDALQPSRSAEARGSRQAFAQRLNVTLLRALVPNAADPVERQGLESLIDGQTAADGLARRCGRAVRFQPCLTGELAPADVRRLRRPEPASAPAGIATGPVTSAHCWL
jgi:hypothetical protein